MPSTYDAIGGRAAVDAAVELFYAKVLSDPLLQPWFDGTDVARLKRHQRAFITLALGGPDEYTGRAMAEAHRGLGITDEAFDRVAGHLAATLAHLGVETDTVDAIISQVAGLRPDVVEGARPPVAS